MNTKDKVPFYVAPRKLEIEVLPPDVNESQVDFAVVEEDPLQAQRGEERRRGDVPGDRRGAGGRPVHLGR
jgi:DNA polymerase III alpha subunit